MPRLEDLPEVARQAVLNYAAFEHDDSPFVAPRRPLSASVIGLVTTAGLHVRGDRPFASDEEEYRVIPAETPARDIVQSHTSIGFDRAAFMRDINITLPVDRLRELVERGVIAGVGPAIYSFNGAVQYPRRLEVETGPEVGRRLQADGVDAVLLTPT